MQTLTPSQIKYIMVSTASKDIRPTLQYAYYFPETKKLASTDSFRLHELSIDLWEEAWIMWTDWVFLPVPDGYKFPNYTSFFPDSPSITTIINRDHLKKAMYFSKYDNYNTIVNFNTNIMRSTKNTPHDMSILVWSIPICTRASILDIIDEFSINSEYLYDSIRYCDAPWKKQDPTLSIRMKSQLSPLIIESSIDWAPCRSLLMPLKM